MLFRTEPLGVLAISQLTHAWIAGQILRAWDETLGEPLPLAAEQHDIGWLDWETTPTFNPQTGRPHLFREIGAAVHSPMWRRGVERALGAWGVHVALLISRHGGVIYRRYTDRHRASQGDAAAARRYLEAHAPTEAAWAGMLGLDAAGRCHVWTPPADQGLFFGVALIGSAVMSSASFARRIGSAGPDVVR